MSFVDRHLLPDEKVVFRTKLHWRLTLVPAALALAVCVPLAVLAFGSDYPAWLGAIPCGVAAAVVAVVLVRRQASEFAVTDKRVVMKLGVFTTRSLEVLLSKVEGVSVTQTVGGKLLGYGDVVITGSGGTREAFVDIQSPLEFRAAVQRASDGRRD